MFVIEDVDGNRYETSSLKKFCDEYNSDLEDDESRLQPRTLRYTHPKNKGRIKENGEKARHDRWHLGYRIVEEKTSLVKSLKEAKEVEINKEKYKIIGRDIYNEDNIHVMTIVDNSNSEVKLDASSNDVGDDIGLVENKSEFKDESDRSGFIKSLYEKDSKGEKRIILAIPDLHAPFIKKGYLQFCKDMYNKYNCDTVVFLGDILDNHYSSYHESDPDGMGAGLEFIKAKKELIKFYKAFPNAKCCIGNHDKLPDRKGFSSGLSNRWIKSIQEVLGFDSWEFSEEFIINDVLYTHGTGRKAKGRMLQDMISVVQGHYHSESYIDFRVGKDNSRKFAMQLGCGVEENEYAFAYGRNFMKQHTNVGIISNDGKLPIIEYMD